MSGVALALVVASVPSQQCHLPLQPFKSFLKRANADISGLSCMLLPFFPRSPHLLGTASSCSPGPAMPWPVRSRRWTAGVLFEELPNMAATDECAQRACFRIADVTVIHSVTTRATGLTATVMGRGSRLAIVSCSLDAAWSSPSVLDMATAGLGYGCVCDKEAVRARRGYGRGHIWTAMRLVQSSCNMTRILPIRWLPGDKDSECV